MPLLLPGAGLGRTLVLGAAVDAGCGVRVALTMAVALGIGVADGTLVTVGTLVGDGLGVGVAVGGTGVLLGIGPDLPSITCTELFDGAGGGSPPGCHIK